MIRRARAGRATAAAEGQTQRAVTGLDGAAGVGGAAGLGSAADVAGVAGAARSGSVAGVAGAAGSGSAAGVGGAAGLGLVRVRSFLAWESRRWAMAWAAGREARYLASSGRREGA